VTERELEQGLRASFQEMVDEAAPAALRASVTAIPDVVPTTPHSRAWWPARRIAEMNTFAKFALTAAAVVVVAVIGINLLPASRGVGGPPALTSPSPSPTATSQPSPTPMSSWEVHPMNGDYSIGRHPVTVDGVPFSFDVPASGWEPRLGVSAPAGGISLNKSFAGSQGAEAIIYWSGFPDGVYADPCGNLLGLPVGASAADVAAAVASAPGTELVTGPSDVTLGGRAAKHVVVIVREDLGCDPGFFYSWEAEHGGAVWLTTDVGHTIRVWIVDVDGTRLFIAGLGNAVMGWGIEQEIDGIIDSIRFE
jgi:hypothetical protein